MTPDKPNPASAGAQTGLGDNDCWAAISPRDTGKFPKKQTQIAGRNGRAPPPPRARPIYPSSKTHHRSKSGLDQICFKLQRDMAILRREVASLRQSIASLTLSRGAVTIDSEAAAAREAAKQKRIEEREAAEQEHAAFVAKQALIQREKDRARAEWEAKEVSRKRDRNRVLSQKWRAANPEKSKASSDRWRAANPEKFKVNTQRWRAANPEKAQKWRTENPEKYKASQDRWRAANREKVNRKRREERAAQKQIQAGPELLDEVSP
jgi:hypothetical protein